MYNEYYGSYKRSDFDLEKIDMGDGRTQYKAVSFELGVAWSYIDTGTGLIFSNVRYQPRGYVYDWAGVYLVNHRKRKRFLEKYPHAHWISGDKYLIECFFCFKNNEYFIFE
jgi:hypothetical protein